MDASLGSSSQGIIVKDRRRHSKNSNHVTWDEEAIAEHDKERGTRQKIDEPDTPFIRSPEAASDDEFKPQSSDDEHRLSIREPVRLSLLPGYEGAFPSGCSSKPAETDVNVEALAHRLDALMKNDHRRGSNSSSEGGDPADHSKVSSTCSSRSSSSATNRRNVPASSNEGGGQRVERRISIEENLQPPKPTTNDFAKKRAQHYNEGKAMKALLQRKSADSSSTESERSDDSDAADLITTNTNTNINTTSLQDDVCRPQADVCRPTLPCSGYDVGIHQSKEEKVKIPIGEPRASGDISASLDSKSPRVSVVSPTSPNVTVGPCTRSAGDEASWKAKREAHYNKMAAAFKAAPPPSSDEDEDSDEAP